MALIGAFIYIVPTFKPGIWPHKQINLGLDLQGGMHLALEVETEKAVENTVERIRNELRTDFRKEGIRFKHMNRSGQRGLSIQLLNPDDLQKMESIFDKQYSDIEIRSTSMDAGVRTVEIALTDKWAREIKKQSTEQALETIRNRIDQFLSLIHI